jgi:hypothetical protein
MDGTAAAVQRNRFDHGKTGRRLAATGGQTTLVSPEAICYMPRAGSDRFLS